MHQSFLDYAMSVITARALPDARDGLKPVHRRILWSMFDTGLRPNRPHKKCATVVGDVIANYHPHGDSSIYEALVRMGQHFSLANPLVDPHGNFGSPNDPPAAYRYTECRLTPLAMTLTEGIDEETVDFTPTFDGSSAEPTVMPARFPNLLVNGSQGIAVGMATNIPTHNLTEVIDAAIHLVENPDAGVADLMRFIPAPDFPTGGAIMGRAGAVDAYKTGRGYIRLRARAEIEETRGGGSRIVVDEIPYQTSVEAIEEKIADLVKRKVLEGIRAVRNESSKGRTRMVVELKSDAHPPVVLNQLYSFTPLQTNFAVNMLALRDGVPRTLTLRDALVAYVDHQIEVVTRRSEHRLAGARERAHVVEGLLRALDLIDAIVVAIRASADRAAALAALCGEELAFSEAQANHILDMQLARLTRLGRSNLEEEITQLRAAIAELEEILGDDARLRRVITDELAAVRDAHPSPRRTEIMSDYGDMEVEDLIENEPLVVTLSAGGYVKTMSTDEFRTQGRGGRGVLGAKLAADDVPVRVLTTTAHSYLMFFTNRAKVYRVKAYKVPKSSRTAKGTALVNLLDLAPGETVQAMIDADNFDPSLSLTFVTRLGMVKRTRFAEYDKTRSKGLIALILRAGDELVRVLETASDDDLLITSRNGRTARFALEEVRLMGRGAAGVRGMRLRAGDQVVAADAAPASDGRDLFLVTDGGYGKRTEMKSFRRT
ncbi:MAG TPA: DNA gyrase subunit A, partial [Acidimicrobiaceae bacterium]|nr:DNA gyrase subunit A [Acidimicrobiaceae bacterium]